MVECCAAGAGPEQIHLSLAGFGDASRMAVAWVDLDGSGSVVEYRALNGSTSSGGGGPGATQTAFGTVVASTTANPLKPWAAGWVGALHAAVMTNLIADSAYEYRVSDGSVAAVWSAWISFKTLPPPSEFAAGRKLTFAILGDMDYGKDSAD